MKFLLDQDVYAITAHFLGSLGHDVALAAELGLSRADDKVLLDKAHELERIFVTRDRDYGNLVFVQGAGAGVIYLRMLPSTIGEVHAELKKALSEYPAGELAKAFVVVETKGHRIRRVK